MSKNDPCIKAVTLAQKGDTSQALITVARCKKNLQKNIKKHYNTPEILFELKKQLVKALRLEAQLQITKNVISKAISLYSQGLTLLNQLRDDNEVLFLKAHINYSLGLIDFLSNNLEGAVGKYTLSKDYFAKISYFEQVVEILFRLIDIKSQTNDLPEAWQFSKEIGSKSKKIKDKGKKQKTNAKLFLVQARILYKQNKEKEGQKFLSKAKNQYDKLDNHEGMINVLLEQTRLQLDLESHKKEDLLLQALEYANLYDLKSYQGVIETELGILLLKSSNFEKGKGRLLKGLKLRTETGDKMGTAQSLLELARISLITSRNEEDLENSLNFSNQANELYSELEHGYGIAQSLELMGTLNTKLNNLDTAHKELKISRKLFKKFKDNNAEARVLTQLGILLDLKNENNESLLVLDKAYSLYQKTNNLQGIAEILQLKANLEEDKIKALELFKRSREIYAQIIGDREDLKPILFTLDVKIKELSD